MSSVSRREMLGALAAGGAVLATAFHKNAGAREKKKRKPNIIYIMADDLGYGDLGCYGQQTIRTPNIDRLAVEGMRFTDCYAGSTVCAPSRCVLMTGLHTGHCYVRGNKRVPLPAQDITVAERLKDAGYATGLIGKWGLGEPDTEGIPNRQGFDEFFGYLNQGRAHTYYPEYLWRDQEKYPLKNEEEKYNVAVKKIEYSHDLFAREALDFVTRHKDEPFFLYLALTIPHANNELGRHSGDGMEVPSYRPYADKDWPDPQKGHAAMITRMDNDIGALMARLNQLDIGEDTVVFFTSDNGPHKEGGADPAFFNSSGPLRGYKRDLYEGGIRVPMIVRWPGRIEAGSVSNLPWGFQDFLPTACAIAETEAPDNIDGISVLPALLGKSDQQKKHDHLYWEFHEGGFKQAVRMENWKAVRPKTDAPIEIYNLAEDIGEKNNLADKHPERVKKAEALFASERTESEHWKTPGSKK
jgi:arylsulfatase A-like enzyme